MSAPEGRSEATGAKAAAPPARLSVILGLVAALRRARLLAPMRPDRYLRVAAAIRREGFSATSGFASAAQRCPERPGLVDELGTLTWRELDRRCAPRRRAALDRHYVPQPPRVR
jgi:hypothetical protein